MLWEPRECLLTENYMITKKIVITNSRKGVLLSSKFHKTLEPTASQSFGKKLRKTKRIKTLKGKRQNYYLFSSMSSPPTPPPPKGTQTLNQPLSTPTLSEATKGSKGKSSDPICQKSNNCLYLQTKQQRTRLNEKKPFWKRYFIAFSMFSLHMIYVWIVNMNCAMSLWQTDWTISCAGCDVRPDITCDCYPSLSPPHPIHFSSTIIINQQLKYEINCTDFTTF